VRTKCSLKTTMKVWILVMAAVALLVWSLARERFNTYEEALADVGQTADTPVPMCPAGTILRDEDELCVSQSATATPQCPSGYQLRADMNCQRNGGTETTDPSCPAGFEFNTDARRCDTTPVEPTCPGDYTYIGNGTCERKASATPTPTPTQAGGGTTDTADPICPPGTSLYVGGYGVPKCEVPVNIEPVTLFICPTGYTRRAGGECLKIGTANETIPPQCPAGKEYSTDRNGCITPMVPATCPANYHLVAGQGEKCIRIGSGSSSPSPIPSPASSAAPTTTGGSSTSTWGPTSGGTSNRLRQVFGPQFTERGNEVRSDDGDSSQTNVYPELLGGLIDSSSRIPGAGIQAPSKNWTMSKDGTLPTSKSMGSDELARYFPFSRSPGDMDIIPDPYRVAQTFSASSYSSKTEPVPFLTDFSAFQK